MSTSELTFAPAVLFASTLICLRVALSVSRRTAAGSSSFVWLMVAVAEWSMMSAINLLTPTVDGKILWAKAQYLGIVSVGPLWLMFAAEYAGAAWIRRPLAVAALWVLPVLTMVVVLARQELVWPSVRLTPDGGAFYEHGPWFWVIAFNTYALLLAGSGHLLLAMRRSPAYRGQFIALIAASLVPWCANLIYVSRALPLGGLDPTSLGFTVSGLLISWALYKRSLFEVIPIALRPAGRRAQRRGHRPRRCAAGGRPERGGAPPDARRAVLGRPACRGRVSVPGWRHRRFRRARNPDHD